MTKEGEMKLLTVVVLCCALALQPLAVNAQHPPGNRDCSAWDCCVDRAETDLRIAMGVCLAAQLAGIAGCAKWIVPKLVGACIAGVTAIWITCNGYAYFNCRSAVNGCDSLWNSSGNCSRRFVCL